MDKNPSILDNLQKSDVFKGLTIEQYDAVIRSGFRKKLQPKSILFHQGDPATCCLVNPDKEKTVEKAFQAIKKMSIELRNRYKLFD